MVQNQAFLFCANTALGLSHTIPWPKYCLYDGESSIYTTSLDFSTELQIHLPKPLHVNS